MKIALGLFHFNVNEVAGEPSACHRYCTQVVLPFLGTIASRKEFRATFEMAGNGLEFLAEHYPSSIDTLRDLIARNQIELISSTYAPTAWVAFPRRDLVQSIQLNTRVLTSLGLTAAPIFFGQEGLFGPGVESLDNWFDIAVCKDDTLRTLNDATISSPVYRLGKVTVVIGANHLLHEMASVVVNASRQGAAPTCSSFYEAHLQEAVTSSLQSAPEYIEGTVDGVQWHWYHCGSAHPFTTTGVPQNWEGFFCDPEWMTMTSGVLERLLDEGYQLGFIGEFARNVASERTPPLPRMIECSWNPKRSRGVYAWMGLHEHRWDAGAALLTLAWRARKKLIETERLLSSLDPEGRCELSSRIDEIWRHQILSESSDPLGLSPLLCEVNFGREQGDRVLEMCATLMSRMPLGLGYSGRNESSNGTHPDPQLAPADAPIQTELIGAEGQITWRKLSEAEYVCEARFRAEEHTCGVRFQRHSNAITYCPSGAEHQWVVIDEAELPQGEYYLPLTNGLISLNSDLHLVRDNCSVGTAARISTQDDWVRFALEGVAEGRLYEWRFRVIRGSVDEAVHVANRINCV